MRKKYRVITKTIEGRTVFIWNQGPKPPKTTVFYLHGGAFIYGFNKMHFKFLKALVDMTDCRIVAPDYPLLPEASADAIHACLLACFQETIGFEQGENVVLLGDSAGGNLALAFAQQHRHIDRVSSARLVLISPWLDVTMEDGRIDEIQPEDPLLDKEALKTLGRRFAGTRDVKDPLVSPLYGALDGIGSIAVWTSTRDILYPDALRLQEKASTTKVHVELHTYEHMLHTWVFIGLPESRRATKEIAEHINRIHHEGRESSIT